MSCRVRALQTAGLGSTLVLRGAEEQKKGTIEKQSQIPALFVQTVVWYTMGSGGVLLPQVLE